MEIILNNFINATKDGYSRYAEFSGLSTRSQYWYFTLANLILSIIASITFGDFGSNIISIITFIPSIAVAVRRVHDVGKSGWFILIPIYNLILVLSPSKPATNWS